VHAELLDDIDALHEEVALNSDCPRTITARQGVSPVWGWPCENGPTPMHSTFLMIRRGVLRRSAGGRRGRVHLNRRLLSSMVMVCVTVLDM